MLLTPIDLGEFMQRSVKTKAAEQAIRVADGWLRSVARIDPWPDFPNVPPDVYSWALELASIAYSNPEGLSSRTVGETARAWDAQRRKEILDAAKAVYGENAGSDGGSAGGPLGCFPEPYGQPDLPAVRRPWC